MTNGLISIPNSAGTGAGQVTAAAFAAEALANPVYGLTFTTIGDVIAPLQALANQLAQDSPAVSGAKNYTSVDTRAQRLLAEIIQAAVTAAES